MTSLIPMHNAALAVGPPQITYIRFKRNISNIFVAICINSADGYRRTRLEVQGDGSTAWQLVDTFGQLNGCVEGVLYFTQVTGNEHLVVNLDAWNTGGSTTARFDLFPTSSDQLNNCAVQSDASSPLIRDPRYRWDTAAGLACAFVDPAAVGITPTATPPLPTPTSRPTLPTSTPPPPSPTPRPHAAVELYGIEVTQAIQNLRNDVVLISDRPTYVRAHVRSQGNPVYYMRAELIGRRNGQPLPGSPIRPYNASGSITVRQTPNRASLNDSYLFALPSSWLNGSIELEVRLVGDTLVCRDHTGQSDDCKTQVTFQPSPNLDVRFVGLTWRDNNTRHTPSWSHYQNASQQLRSVLPVPRISWDAPYSIEPVFFADRPTNSSQFSRFNDMLWINRLLDGCGWGCKRYYVGLVIDPPMGQRIVAGQAKGIPGDVVSGYVDIPGVITHEMGHAIGRRHVSCTADPNDEAGPDSNFPYPGGKISRDNTGDNAYYGFNIANRAIFGPETGDLMSYCVPSWPSDYTYTRMRDYLVSRYGTPAAISTMTAMAAGTEMIVLSGSMEPGISGTFGEGYLIKVPVDTATPAGGSYAIRFDDASGQTLAIHKFDPLDQVEDSPKIFYLALPWPQNTHRVLLIQGDQVLASRVVSVHAPSIGSLTPIGGVLQGNTTISWSATDDDGDSLLYAVQFSADSGTTWQTLVSNWPTNTLDIDFDILPKTSNGVLRVLASDGILTAQAQTRNPIIIQPAPPIAIINDPTNGAHFLNNQALVLSGQGYDKDDGELVGQSLQWISNRDGSLGYGQSLVIDSSTLSEGDHKITLTVTDNDGQVTQSTTSIHIAHMDENAAPILLVETTNLEFVVRQGDVLPITAPLILRAIGQGEASWFVQSDSDWLTLSKTNGTTPDDLFASVQPVGLAPGEHTATIIVTSAQDNSISESIPVRVFVEPNESFTVYLPMLRR